MTPEPPRTSQPQLVRAIGRWSMVALAVNSILGSGIFGLPSVVAGLAGVNLLVIYLGEFWPAATQPLPRLSVISVFLASLAAVNYRGVAAGTLVSNASVVAKLAALGMVCVAGVLYLSLHPRVAAAPVAASVDGWLQAMLLLLFAYGGYEAALNPMGEARDPRRDAAFALFVALLILTALYALLQLIVVGVLADAAHSARPLADAARVVIGPAGAALISAGALISVYGYISANMLTAPRGTFALAERGDFPAWFARVHPRFRTPYCSILVFALLLWGFSQFASFSWNVTLSAVARLFFYAAVCVAVPVLRRRQAAAALWRLPGGPILPLLGVIICAVLLTRVDFSKSLILLATIGAACANWLMVRRSAVQAASGG